jgi:hypothetical protein
MNQIAAIKTYERMCREECKTAKQQFIMSQYWLPIRKTMEQKDDE